MATASTIRFTTALETEYSLSSITAHSADSISYLLQQNHDENDIIYTDWGAHNHIVHHLCTSFALGATAEVLQKNFAVDNAEQRRPPPLHGNLIRGLQDPKVFISKLNTELSLSSDFIKFFEKEIDEKGCEEVIREYIFKGNERANIMFNRLFSCMTVGCPRSCYTTNQSSILSSHHSSWFWR